MNNVVQYEGDRDDARRDAGLYLAGKDILACHNSFATFGFFDSMQVRWADSTNVRLFANVADSRTRARNDAKFEEENTLVSHFYLLGYVVQFDFKLIILFI